MNPTIIQKISSEPFRLFFPLGTLIALVGISYWPLLQWYPQFYHAPFPFHSNLMIDGFVFSFVMGFLTTAVPRFTRAAHFTILEVMSLLILLLAAGLATLSQQFWWHHLIFLANLVVLIIFLGKRFFARSQNPPFTFVYLPFGFAAGLLGNILFLFFPVWENLAKAYLFQGMVLFFLMGVGGFLIRSILGWAESLPESKNDKLPTFRSPKKQLFLHLGLASSIFLSFLVESFIAAPLGLGLRALLVTMVVFIQMKIYRKSPSGKLTAYALQTSLWLLVVGFWGAAFLPPQYRVGFLHFCFVGGFSLSTFSIASRVILSHCGYSQLLKGRFLPFSIAVVLIVLASLVRISANLFPEVYTSHLSYASITWSLGVLIWMYAILWKAVKSTFGD